MITAALATIPGREAALETCLRSLRPQVDSLRVVCHNMAEPPAAVRALADIWVCEPDQYGSAAKLRWARDVHGLYLGCDDDLEYPPDYAQSMLRWVRRWKGRAICAVGGWVFEGNARRYPDEAQQLGYPIGGNLGRWVNYPIAAGLAFDTRLNVPSRVPEKNQEEAYLAIWAQRYRVPIWLVPKPKGWLRWLLERSDPGPTIWASEREDGYSVRRRLTAEPASRGWTVPEYRSTAVWPPADAVFAEEVAV